MMMIYYIKVWYWSVPNMNNGTGTHGPCSETGGARLTVDSTDLDIMYGVGWSDFDLGRGGEALKPGTSLNLSFHGMSMM